MTKNLGTWLVGNAGLISVIGALIIFFSWTVTNTFGQRYSRLKQSVEAADNTFRLYTALHELRDSLNSVAMETVYAREAAEHGSKSPQDRELSEIADLRRQYSHTRMAAHQIKEMMDFASQTLDYSSSVGTATPTSQKIKTLHEDIYRLYARARDLDRAVERTNATPTPSIPPLRKAIEEYIAYVRSDAIPRVASLYEAIVNASNDRHDEGRRELAQSKRNAARAARTALMLYVVGSLLALGGQYLDKVYKKTLETAKKSSNPVDSATAPRSSPNPAAPADQKAPLPGR